MPQHRSAGQETLDWVYQNLPGQRELLEGATGDQLVAINSYQATQVAIQANRAFRVGIALNSNSQEMFDNLKVLFDKSKAEKAIHTNIIGYRGVSGEFGRNIREGLEITEPGFGSVSLKESVAEGFAGVTNESVLWKIKIPAGTPGVYVPPGRFKEAEILMPPGTKFKIGKELPGRGFGRIFEVEIIE
jgi:hypothetical protein